jgi:hypothetical protein
MIVEPVTMRAAYGEAYLDFIQKHGVKMTPQRKIRGVDLRRRMPDRQFQGRRSAIARALAGGRQYLYPKRLGSPTKGCSDATVHGNDLTGSRLLALGVLDISQIDGRDRFHT